VLRHIRIGPAAAAAPADRPQSLQRRHPVLVVDDGGGYAGEIKRLLTAMRMPWEACAPGPGTIEAVRHDPACLITPGGNGADWAGTLIEAVHEVAPGLAVIVVIDNPDVAATVAAMRVGAHAVIDGRALATGLLHQVTPLLQSS
jgi:DNA-binding NtrC family response regulator